MERKCCVCDVSLTEETVWGSLNHTPAYCNKQDQSHYDYIKAHMSKWTDFFTEIFPLLFLTYIIPVLPLSILLVFPMPLDYIVLYYFAIVFIIGFYIAATCIMYKMGLFSWLRFVYFH